jgi:hypothetical protein
LVDLKFTNSKEFELFNNRGYLIFEYNGKLGVIDNHDPIGVNESLYEKADLYFVTNKVKGNPSYERDNIFPLFPHYPVNIKLDYFKIFGFNPIIKLHSIELLKELYAQSLRTEYRLENFHYQSSNYIFFSGSIWKKEERANELRASFIESCKQNPSVHFEGGFIKRKDGIHYGLEHLLNSKKYTPKEFARLSKKSRVIFNNPAVLGAVSWRLAESQNLSSFVLSFPFNIHLPVNPEHGNEIHFIKEKDEIPEAIDYIMKNDSYHKKVARGGKGYFDKYCQPEGQINYILNFF